MAKTLKKFNFDTPVETLHDRRQKYPWAQWLDGRIWKIQHGEDFHVEPLMMERIIRTRVSSFKMKVRLRHAVDEETQKTFIIMQAEGDLPPNVRGVSNGEVVKAPAPAAKQAAKTATPAKKAAPTPTPAKKVAAAKAPVAKAPAKKAAAKAAPAPAKAAAAVKTPTKRATRHLQAVTTPPPPPPAEAAAAVAATKVVRKRRPVDHAV